MHLMNEYLRTAPFDLYELHLFQLVAAHGSFTKAAAVAGLTQSAVTRQVQGIEAGLGVALFERTTRSVRLTPAGTLLLGESGRLLGGVQETLQRVREEFAGARRQVRLGLSRSISLAYLPGFLHADLRRQPQVGHQVSYRDSTGLLSALEANELDAAILCPPARLPATVRVTHRFRDDFTLIGPASEPNAFTGAARKKLSAWAARQNWILLDETSHTGRRLRQWMKQRGLGPEPAMTFDSFDPIINLVALGLGVSFVPTRALALYARKRHLRRIPCAERFTRDLVVVVRRHRTPPAHLVQFIDNVLF